MFVNDVEFAQTELAPLHSLLTTVHDTIQRGGSPCRELPDFMPVVRRLHGPRYSHL